MRVALPTSLPKRCFKAVRPGYYRSQACRPSFQCANANNRRQFILRRSTSDGNGVEEVVLSPIRTADELEQDRQWVSMLVTTWLDEEWTPLDVHKQLGEAAANAYCNLRQSGEDDLGSLLLGMSSQLLAFNYRDTFVNAFDVSNKVAEALMMKKNGIDVCCTTALDRERIERVDDQLCSDAAKQTQ